MSGRRVALIVASYNYTDPALNRLVAPADDAELLGRVLADPDIGDFEVQVLSNEPHYVVRRQIASLFRGLTREDLAVLYFSGHGIKDQSGNLHLATVDTDHKLPQATAVEDRFVRSQMEESRSQSQILILDCCYSGTFAKGMVHRGDERIGTAEHFKGRGQVVLAASDAMQYAFEGDEVSGQGVGSVFTRTIVEGLRSGEADQDHDGHISVNELFEYSHRHVRARLPQQTPIMSAIGAQGQLIVARNPRPTFSAIELPPELQEVISSPNPTARLGAVEALESLLLHDDQRVVLAADRSLSHLIEDDSRRVSARAVEILNNHRRQRLIDRLALGRRAFEAGKWSDAIRQLELVVDTDTGYEDASRLLEAARRHRDSERRYTEAVRHHRAQNWQKVLLVLEELHAVDPDYPDSQGLAAASRAQLDEQELDHLYQHALRHHRNREWDVAVDLFELLQRRRPRYRDVELKLTEARQSLANKAPKGFRHANQRVGKNSRLTDQSATVRKPRWLGRRASDLQIQPISTKVPPEPPTEQPAEQAKLDERTGQPSISRRVIAPRGVRMACLLTALFISFGTFLPWANEYGYYGDVNKILWDYTGGPVAAGILVVLGFLAAWASFRGRLVVVLILSALALAIELLVIGEIESDYDVEVHGGAVLTFFVTALAGFIAFCHLIWRKVHGFSRRPPKQQQPQ